MLVGIINGSYLRKVVYIVDWTNRFILYLDSTLGQWTNIFVVSFSKLNAFNYCIHPITKSLSSKDKLPVMRPLSLGEVMHAVIKCMQFCKWDNKNFALFKVSVFFDRTNLVLHCQSSTTKKQSLRNNHAYDEQHNSKYLLCWYFK